jgi:CO/xanthine dehydrogenase Mo-binding subunit
MASMLWIGPFTLWPMPRCDGEGGNRGISIGTTLAIVPAIANAIFAATGKRLRKMLVDTSALKQPA